MKATIFTLAGREVTLAFTGEAMFTIREKYGEVANAVSAYAPDTREAMDAAVEVAAILAEQGELARRAFGYDPREIVSAATIKATITPSEIYALKSAITTAIELGYGREVENEEEIDLNLAELQAQKKTT